jgi:hypothetical protein
MICFRRIRWAARLTQWWLRFLVSPYRGWRAAYLYAAHGHVILAVLILVPLAVPAGLLAGG